MNSPAKSALGPIMTSVSGVELTNEDKERLLSPVIGGVVLLAPNCESPEQIHRLTDTIHTLRDPALLIAVDQEGGRVQRVKDGVTSLPPQARFGEQFDENPDIGCEAAETAGYLMARELIDIGIDLSFSPVLDVSTVDSDVIGDRSFHSDPHTVARIAEEWCRGMQKAGMKATGKHFPGHGGVGADSHLEVPEDKRTIREILDCDLVPYRRLGSRLSAIMTAHIWYSDITSAIPTYSSFWLEHILREVLAFYGPVFSDDLSMQGAGDAGDMETRVLTALSSGCDITLICQSTEDTDRAIESLMSNRDAWKSPTWHYDNLRPDVVGDKDDIDRCRAIIRELID